ncbi:hypothetical protein pb186bvf_007674 [Paramecium bursaria]
MFLYLFLIRQIQSSIFDTMCVSDKKILYQIHQPDNDFLMMWIRILNQGQYTSNSNLQSFVILQQSNRTNQQKIQLICLQNDKLNYNLVVSNQTQELTSVKVNYLEWIHLQWDWSLDILYVQGKQFLLNERNVNSNIFFFTNLLEDEFISYQACLKEDNKMIQQNIIEQIINQEIVQYEEINQQSINNLDVKGFKIQFWVKVTQCKDYILIDDRTQIIFLINFEDDVYFQQYNEKEDNFQIYSHPVEEQQWINIFYSLKYQNELTHEYTIIMHSSNNKWTKTDQVPLSLSFYMKCVVQISQLQFKQFHIQQNIKDSELIYDQLDFFNSRMMQSNLIPVHQKAKGCMFGFFSLKYQCFQCPIWNDQVCNECLFDHNQWIENLTCKYYSIFDQNSNIVGQKYQIISYLFFGEESKEQLIELQDPISQMKLHKNIKGCLYYQNNGCLIISHKGAQNIYQQKDIQNSQQLLNYFNDTIILRNQEQFILFFGQISNPDIQISKQYSKVFTNNHASTIFSELQMNKLNIIDDKIFDYQMDIIVIKSLDLLNLEFLGLYYNSLQSILNSLNFNKLNNVRQILINVSFQASERYEIDFYDFNQMIQLDNGFNQTLRLEIKGNGFVTFTRFHPMSAQVNISKSYKSVIIIRLSFNFVDSMITINNFAQRLSLIDIHFSGDLQIVLNQLTEKLELCNITYVSARLHETTFIQANVINQLEIYINLIIFTAFNVKGKDFILIETKQKGTVIFSLLEANFFDFHIVGKSLIKIGGQKSELYMQDVQIINLTAINSTIIDIQQSSLFIHSSHIIETKLDRSIFFTFKQSSFKFIMFDYLKMKNSQLIRNVVSYKSYFPIIFDSVLILHSHINNSTIIKSDSLWKDEILMSNFTVDEIILESNDHLCIFELVQSYASIELFYITQIFGKGIIFCINSLMIQIEQFSFYGSKPQEDLKYYHPQLFYFRNVRDLDLFNLLLKDYLQTTQYAILLNNSIQFYQNITFQNVFLDNIEMKLEDNYTQQSFIYMKSNDIIQVRLHELLIQYLLIHNNQNNNKQYFINIQTQGFTKINEFELIQFYQSIFNGSFINIQCGELQLNQLSFRLLYQSEISQRIIPYQSYLEFAIDDGNLTLIQIYNSINSRSPLFNFLPTLYCDITFKRIIITNVNQSHVGGVLNFLGQSKNFRLHVDQAFIDYLYVDSGSFINIQKQSISSIIKLYQIGFDSCISKNNQLIDIKVDSVLNIIRILRLTINSAHRWNHDQGLNCSALQITHGDVLIQLLSIDKSICSQLMLHDIQYLMIYQILIQESFFQNNLIEIEMVQDIKIMDINQERNIWDLNEIVTIQKIYLSGNKYQFTNDISLIDFVNFKSKRVIFSQILINKHEQRNNLSLINIKDYGQISNSTKTVHLKGIQLINNYCGYSSCMNFIGYFHSHAILLYIVESFFLQNRADNIISVMGFRSIQRHILLFNNMLNHKSVQVTLFPLIDKSKFEYCEFISQQGFSHFPTKVDSFYVYEYNNERIINKGSFNAYRLGVQINKFQFPVKRIEYSDIIIDTIDLDQLQQAEAIYLPSGQMIQDYQILDNLTYYLYIDDFRVQLFDYQENQILMNDLICQIEFNQSILQTGTTLDNWNFKIIQDPMQNKTAQLTIRCLSMIQEQFFQNYEFNFKIKTFRCQLGEILIENQCLPCDDIKNISLIQKYCPFVSQEIIQEQKRGLIKIYPGFWRPSFLSNAIQCINPKACLGGWNVNDESCQIGHISILCNECDTENKKQNGIYYKYNNECILCEYPQQYGLFIIKLLLVAKFYQLLISYLKIQIYQSKLNLLKLITSTKFYKSIHKLSNNINFTMLKILIFYNQLTIYFQYPNSNVINQFLSFPFTILNGNLQCLSTYYVQFIIRQFTFISSILFIFTCVLRKRQLVELSLMIFLFSLPSIFKEFLQISSYQEILGTKYVMDNFRFVFLSKYHFPIFIFGLCILLTVIGLIFHFLYRKSKSSYQYKIKHQYIFNELKADFNYWNLIKISYQLLFITICQFQERSLLTIVLILALLYTWALIKFKPYYLNNINSFEINIQSINILFYSLNFIHFNQSKIIQDIINYLYLQLIMQRLIKLLVQQNSLKYHKLFMIFWVFNSNHNQERTLIQFKIIKQRLKDIIQYQLKNQISSNQNLPEYKIYEDNPQNPKDWQEIEMPQIRK